jgi:hypothetical protein
VAYASHPEGVKINSASGLTIVELMIAGYDANEHTSSISDGCSIGKTPLSGQSKYCKRARSYLKRILPGTRSTAAGAFHFESAL